METSLAMPTEWQRSLVSSPFSKPKLLMYDMFIEAKLLKLTTTNKATKTTQ